LGITALACAVSCDWFDKPRELIQGGATSMTRGPVPVVESSYDLGAHQTLSRVILLIRENYVDPGRIRPYDMFLEALASIEKTVPEVLIDRSKAPKVIKVTSGAVSQNFELGQLDQLWEVTMGLRDVFRFLEQQLDSRDVRRDVEYAAINGMLSTLDPHSILLKPKSFEEVKISTKGEFGGLGIVISIRDGTLTVMSPIPGTPASRSGLKARDKIMSIGEESTINMGLEDAVTLLRGKPGTQIVIWILRQGWSEAKRFTLTRAIIKPPSVKGEALDNKLGYIRIISFQNNTYGDLKRELATLREKHQGELNGLVLDLRNNPGGLLDQAIRISDHFIAEGELVITVGKGNRKRDPKFASSSGTEKDLPIVVLVNGGSASASEIVAGALKNHNRALVLGQQTFGKGSVQVLYDFKDDSALKLTIAQYLTPGDVSIQSVGIAPNIDVVSRTANNQRIHLFADIHTTRERDLNKHLSQHGEATSLLASDVHLERFVTTTEIESYEESSGDLNEFKDDFEIKLASDILVHKASADARIMLQGADSLFAKHKDTEDKKIAGALTKLGLDWSEGAKPASSSVETTLSTNVNAKGVIRAGQTLDVKLTVVNRDRYPMYQVHGITKSDNMLFDNLEFAIGRLNPGEERSWTTSIKLPDDLKSRGDRISVQLHDQHAVLKHKKASTFVQIRSSISAHLAYIVSLDDKKGNRDGIAQPGEEVDVVVRVTNLGRGASGDTKLILKNLSGRAVFLDKGRESLGLLKPGQSKAGRLQITVKQPIEAIKLRLSIWDSQYGGILSNDIVLPVLAGEKSTSAKRLLQLKPGNKIPIYAGVSYKTPITAYAKAGSKLSSRSHFSKRWYRVPIAQGGFGFIHKEHILKSRPGGKKAKASISMNSGQSPPVVTFKLQNLVTSEPEISLKGQVSDETALRDMFVFVNDEKVYYKELSQLSIKGKPNVIPFAINLPLKAGFNSVALVVRENKELLTRKIFGLYRRPAPVLADGKSDAPKPNHTVP
jgi:carboxyl-terminal processing protease